MPILLFLYQNGHECCVYVADGSVGVNIMHAQGGNFGSAYILVNGNWPFMPIQFQQRLVRSRVTTIPMVTLTSDISDSRIPIVRNS